MLMAATSAVPTSAGFEPAFDLATYYPIFIYLAVCILIPVAALVVTHVINPKKKTAVKLMPYESGMDPVGSAQHKFDIKFYLIAILFLVFDVELLFLYPWAVIAYREDGGQTWRLTFGRIVFIEMMIFIGTLAVAYLYAWRKGVFKWR
jgi:NADH:ubiquinone oxidoreductase subunit 3 (subunit A)